MSKDTYHPRYLATFAVTVSIPLSDGQLATGMRAINEYYTGSGFLSPGQKSTPDHRDAQTAIRGVCGGRLITLQVGLLANGMLEVVK